MNLVNMLPAPVLTYHRRGQLWNIILSRSRVTNLGLILLSAFAILSLILNLTLYYSSRGIADSTVPASHSWVSDTTLTQPPTISSHIGILSTISRPEAFRHLDHLVVVPGHAIWNGTRADLRLDPGEWVLEEYQRGGGRVATFVRHITQG
jgi:hypothetical protein